MHVDELSAQLRTLADTVVLSGFEDGPALLRRAVTELTETPLSPSAWIEVVTLVGQAGIAAPGLVAELRAALLAQWPLTPSAPPLDDADRAGWWRFELARLVRTTAEQTEFLLAHGAAVPSSNLGT